MQALCSKKTKKTGQIYSASRGYVCKNLELRLILWGGGWGVATAAFLAYCCCIGCVINRCAAEFFFCVSYRCSLLKGGGCTEYPR
jgi:hypothetical protein